jgi:hypothetical protein
LGAEFIGKRRSFANEFKQRFGLLAAVPAEDARENSIDEGEMVKTSRTLALWRLGGLPSTLCILCKKSDEVQVVFDDILIGKYA